MVKILFVCHGNICRSVMAEYMFKYLLKENGMEDQFEVSSAGTSSEELGNDIYPPAKKELDKHDIPYQKHSARKLTKEDYQYYDLLIGMDFMNVANMNRMFDNDPDNKIRMLMRKDIDDPWYTGDFDSCYQEIMFGLRVMINVFERNKQKAGL